MDIEGEVFGKGNPFLTRTDYTYEDVERACAEVDLKDPVNAVISVFYLTIKPDVKFSSPFVRKSAETVVRAFGPEGAFRLAKIAVACFHREFFPRADSPQKLAEKMARIAAAASKVIEDRGRKRKIIEV